MPSFREQTKDGYKALKKKLVQLARVDKSFTKHVKQLHVYERNEEKIQAKHFEEATEVGGQVLDDFIQHRIKIMQNSINVNKSSKRSNRSKRSSHKKKHKNHKKQEKSNTSASKAMENLRSHNIPNRKLQSAIENVDGHIEGMRQQDRRKLTATWNTTMEKAYVEFLHKGRSNRKTLALKGKSDDAVDNQARVRQEMANFLRFGKITIKLETTQTNRYRHRLVGGADGNRRIVRELINQPGPTLLQMNPIRSHGTMNPKTTTLWKKIKTKVKKIGDARKLGDKSYGKTLQTGFNEKESATAEVRLAEHILVSHNWGVEDYINERAHYLKVRSKHRAFKNEARRRRINRQSKMKQNRRQFLIDVEKTKEHLHAMSKRYDLNLDRLVDEFRKYKSNPRSLHEDFKRDMPGISILTCLNSKRMAKKWRGKSNTNKRLAEDDEAKDVDKDENATPRDNMEEVRAQPKYKRVYRQTNKYLVRVKNRGGGGFATEVAQTRMPPETVENAAITLQKYMRGYISRRYVWGKRWLLQDENQYAIFRKHSGGGITLDLRPFAVLAGMLGKSLPQQRTIENHKFIIKYDLFKQHGCTFSNFKKWFKDEKITKADNLFQQIRVQKLARVQVYDICQVYI